MGHEPLMRPRSIWAAQQSHSVVRWRWQGGSDTAKASGSPRLAGISPDKSLCKKPPVSSSLLQPPIRISARGSDTRDVTIRGGDAGRDPGFQREILDPDRTGVSHRHPHTAVWRRHFSHSVKSSLGIYVRGVFWSNKLMCHIWPLRPRVLLRWQVLMWVKLIYLSRCRSI